MSVSLAVASGANPVQGIITAIWAGLTASIFGGSTFNVVGPAGALSGILALYSLEHGFLTIPVIAIISGIIILAAYLLKLEKYLVFIPASVIHGFTLGVAILLIKGQWTTIMVSPAAFILLLVVLFSLTKFIPKIPPVIAVSIVGILIGYLYPSIFVTLGDKYPSFHGAIFQTVNFNINFNSTIFTTSLTIALVAILETMLSAKIADGMTHTKYNRHKEMLGLGLANIVSGALGGLPATGVLARTSLNIKSGANSKISSLINSIAIAVISILLLNYFRYIPMVAIASILTFVAIRMVEIENFVKMWNFDKKTLVISLLVSIITVVNDPVKGILLGTSISLLLLIEKISRGQFDITLNSRKKGIVHKQFGEKLDLINKKGDTLVYSIKGQLIHLNSHSHIDRFEHHLNGYKNIVLRLRETYFIDTDGIECISEIIQTVEKQKRKIVITGVSKFVDELLMESVEYRNLKSKGLVFNKTSDALIQFGYRI